MSYFVPSNRALFLGRAKNITSATSKDRYVESRSDEGRFHCLGCSSGGSEVKREPLTMRRGPLLTTPQPPTTYARSEKIGRLQIRTQLASSLRISSEILAPIVPPAEPDIYQFKSRAKEPRRISSQDAIAICGRQLNALDERIRFFDVHGSEVIRADHHTVGSDKVDKELQGLRIIRECVVMESPDVFPKRTL